MRVLASFSLTGAKKSQKYTLIGITKPRPWFIGKSRSMYILTVSYLHCENTKINFQESAFQILQPRVTIKRGLYYLTTS